MTAMKRSILDEFFEALDPEVAIEPTARRVYAAMHSFPGRAVDVQSHDELQDYLAAFACHVENAVFTLNPPQPVHRRIHWNYCEAILRKRYGEVPLEAATVDAQTGLNGGLQGLLALLAEGFIEKYTRDVIGQLVDDYLGEKPEVRHKLAHVYIERFCHLLPPELTELKGFRAFGQIRSVLTNHAYILRRVRRQAFNSQSSF